MAAGDPQASSREVILILKEYAMHSLSKAVIRGVVLAGLVAAWLSAAGTASASTPGKVALKAPPVQDQSEFAGSDTCLGCHEDKAASIKGGAHARAFNPKTPASAQGCESCHGGGKAHAEAGATRRRSPRSRP